MENAIVYLGDINKVDFLCFQVENGKVGIKAEKLTRLWELNRPKNVSELRSLLGFTGFFKKIISNYTEIILPLLARLKKDVFAINGKEMMPTAKTTKAIKTAKPISLPGMSKIFMSTVMDLAIRLEAH